MGRKAEIHLMKDEGVDRGDLLQGRGLFWKAGQDLKSHEVEESFILADLLFCIFCVCKLIDKKSSADIDLLKREAIQSLLGPDAGAEKLAMGKMLPAALAELQLFFREFFFWIQGVAGDVKSEE